MAYILKQIIEKVRVIPEALAFLKPVNKKTVQNYYDVITNPIDLQSIALRIDGKFSLDSCKIILTTKWFKICSMFNTIP